MFSTPFGLSSQHLSLIYTCPLLPHSASHLWNVTHRPTICLQDGQEDAALHPLLHEPILESLERHFEFCPEACYWYDSLAVGRQGEAGEGRLPTERGGRDGGVVPDIHLYHPSVRLLPATLSYPSLYTYRKRGVGRGRNNINGGREDEERVCGKVREGRKESE